MFGGEDADLLQQIDRVMLRTDAWFLAVNSTKYLSISC